MLELCKLMCVGRFTADPELRYTPGNPGKAVASGRIAINRRRGEEQTTVFLGFVAWEKTAEFIDKYFKKGSPAYFEGRLDMETWTDKKSNEPRERVIMVVERVQFVEGKADKQDAGRSTETPPTTFGEGSGF